jgi:putative AlgH/UPF0301 family transcriptional regulator
MKYENGQTYIINHSRKGTFGIHVESQDDEWITTSKKKAKKSQFANV